MAVVLCPLEEARYLCYITKVYYTTYLLLYRMRKTVPVFVLKQGKSLDMRERGVVSLLVHRSSIFATPEVVTRRYVNRTANRRTAPMCTRDIASVVKIINLTSAV
jgi:hypothetical protein